jgi:hypothetical protein
MEGPAHPREVRKQRAIFESFQQRAVPFGRRRLLARAWMATDALWHPQDARTHRESSSSRDSRVVRATNLNR